MPLNPGFDSAMVNQPFSKYAEAGLSIHSLLGDDESGYLRVQEEIAQGKDVEKKDGGLPFPHWICQPYVRPPWVTSHSLDEKKKFNQKIQVFSRILSNLLKRCLRPAFQAKGSGCQRQQPGGGEEDGVPEEGAGRLGWDVRHAV